MTTRQKKSTRSASAKKGWETRKAAAADKAFTDGFETEQQALDRQDAATYRRRVREEQTEKDRAAAITRSREEVAGLVSSLNGTELIRREEIGNGMLGSAGDRVNAPPPVQYEPPKLDWECRYCKAEIGLLGRFLMWLRLPMCSVYSCGRKR